MLGFLFGRTLLEALLPLFRVVITLVQGDFAPTLDIAGVGGEMTVRMSAYTTRAIPLTADRLLLPGTPVNYTATSVLHALVPAVPLLTPLLAWPIGTWREGLSRGLLGVPAFFLVMLTTTPLFLAGRFQMAIGDMARRYGGQLDDTWLVRWAIFTEMGGRWLVPILAAVVCIVMAQRLARSEA
jgi:hypothetical protein